MPVDWTARNYLPRYDQRVAALAWVTSLLSYDASLAAALQEQVQQDFSCQFNYLVLPGAQNGGLLICDTTAFRIYAFPGTTQRINWAGHLWRSGVSRVTNRQNDLRPIQGRVFASANAYWADALSRNSAFTEVFDGPGRPVVFTGHSIGGAVAAIAAAVYARYHTGTPVTVFGFGAPKFGNGLFFSEVDDTTWFFVNAVGDNVVFLPPAAGFVQSPFSSTNFADAFFQGGTQLWLLEDGTQGFPPISASIFELALWNTNNQGTILHGSAHSLGTYQERIGISLGRRSTDVDEPFQSFRRRDEVIAYLAS